MATVTLSEIIETANKLSQNSRGLAEQAAAATQERSSAARQVADNTREAGKIVNDLEQKRSLAQLEAKKLAKNNAAAMGLDATASNEIITQVGSQMREDMLKYISASKQLEQIDANDNLLSNPLGWFNSLMNRQEVEAVAEQSLARMNNASTMMSRLYALSDSDFKTQLALAETADANDIALGAKAAALNAESNALKAEIDAAGYDIEGYRILTQLGTDEFNRRVGIYNMLQDQQRHSESMRMQGMQLDIMRRNFARAEAQDKAGDYLAATANVGARILGFGELPKELILDNYGKATPIGQRLALLELVGTKSMLSNSATIGESPMITREIIQSTGGNFPQSMDPAIVDTFAEADEELNRVISQASAISGLAGVTATANTYGLNADTIDNPELVAEAYNKIFNERLEKKYKGIPHKSLTFSELEKLPDFRSIAASPTYQKVIAPLAASADTPITIPRLAPIVAEAVASGEVSSEQASSDMAKLSKIAYANYASASGARMIGAKLPAGDFSKIVIETGETFSIWKALTAPVGSFGVYNPTKEAATFHQRGRVKDTINLDTTSPSDWSTYFQILKATKNKKEVAEKLSEELNK